MPVYAAVPPAWDAERVAEFGAQIGVRGDVTDAGVWFVLKDGKSTLEVYQASQSFRLEQDDFDMEGRNGLHGGLDRARAIAMAEQFHGMLGGPDTRPESALRHRTGGDGIDQGENRARTPGRRVAGQSSLRRGRHAARGTWREGASHRGTGRQHRTGLPLLAENQAIGDSTERAGRAGIRAFRCDRPVRVATGLRKGQGGERSVGLLCLPPTEAQGILVPTYVLRGEVATESLSR